ncbi:succinate dehydrogenase subunit 7A, mitochondrial-like isoform X3 [Apium graveolens]|uniref:succinate dehydrogenase subunit 7A, mitochondrial-like isoform X3 n=1 Tax=Apium graveolens TaxID=4045 RepID=UPI003D799DC0
MAFLHNRPIFSPLRSHSQKSEDLLGQLSRGIHTEAGAREKAEWQDCACAPSTKGLLAPDPALDRFKSYKKSVKRVKKIGDVLTVVVAAGCCYEIYVRATTQK